MVRFPVDLGLLDGVNHMPSLPVLQRSLPAGSPPLRDFCIPVNAYFPDAGVLADLAGRIADVLRYYPAENDHVARDLAEFTGIAPEHLVLGNGATELITWINTLLVTSDLVTDVPTFGRWTDNPRELGRRVHEYERREEDGFAIDVDEFVRFVHARRARAAAISNPSNPTGALLPTDQLARLLDGLSDLDVVVVDESFVDFANDGPVPTIGPLVHRWPNVIVVKSLGKNLGLHGLRCGYAVASPHLAGLLRHHLPPWNVNAVAAEFIRVVTEEREAYEASRRQVVRDRERCERELARVPGLTVFPSRANFLYTRLAAGVDGVAVRDALLREHGCFVRECGSKIGSSSRYLRIATRPPGEWGHLVAALGRTLSDHVIAASKVPITNRRLAPVA